MYPVPERANPWTWFTYEQSRGLNTTEPAMLFRAFTLASFIVLAGCTVAQSKGGDVPFDKEHIHDGARLKTALAAIRKGDALAIRGGLDLPRAMASYEEALRINPDNAELNLKLGVCILNGPHPHTALATIQRAEELDPALPRVHYLLGFALQLNAKWDEAVEAYTRHAQIIRLSPDPDRTYNMVDKHITECRNGKALMASPVRATVMNLGSAVNTVGGEYGALLDPKGRLYFTARRVGTTGGKVNKVNNQWFEDIYGSRWEANGWSAAQPLPEPLNCSRNDATVSLSADGNQMILYRDEEDGGDLHVSVRSGSGWTVPVPLSAPVNSSAQESSAWRTADGRWLYFVSSREGGLGGSDIYRSPWDAVSNTWGDAENLGPDINTIYDEDGVFLPADGNTLYFASQGHFTIGGYDLFKSRLTNGRWSKPENLGWPVNSPGDDQFLVLSADGTTGYFNSVRPGGVGGDDIYRVEFPVGRQVDHTAMLVSAGQGIPMSEDDRKLRLIGFIKGLKMMEPINATVEFMALEDPVFKASFTTAPNTGEFTAEVPAGQDYVVHVTADGYLIHSEHVESAKGQVRMDVDLKGLDPGNTEVMRNIFFERNSYKLKESSASELEKLAEFLGKHPALRIEVQGHTDSDVGPIPNQELSEARAYVVFNWLVAHGISPDRLEAKGYGDSMPMRPNMDEGEKALNRRTVIRVL